MQNRSYILTNIVFRTIIHTILNYIEYFNFISISRGFDYIYLGVKYYRILYLLYIHRNKI